MSSDTTLVVRQAKKKPIWKYNSKGLSLGRRKNACGNRLRLEVFVWTRFTDLSHNHFSDLEEVSSLVQTRAELLMVVQLDDKNGSPD